MVHNPPMVVGRNGVDRHHKVLAPSSHTVVRPDIRTVARSSGSLERPGHSSRG